MACFVSFEFYGLFTRISFITLILICENRKMSRTEHILVSPKKWNRRRFVENESFTYWVACLFYSMFVSHLDYIVLFLFEVQFLRKRIGGRMILDRGNDLFGHGIPKSARSAQLVRPVPCIDVITLLQSKYINV